MQISALRYIINSKFQKKMIKIVLLVLFLAAWLAIARWSHLTALKAFKKYSKFQKIANLQPKYEALVRTDYQNWNKQGIIIGCYVLVPIRMMLFISLMAGCLVFAGLIKIFGNRTITNRLFTLYLNTYGKFVSRMMCTVYQKFERKKILSPIVICNHVNWFDIFYLTMGYAPLSFVTKAQILKWPVIGILAKSRQCVFVSRESQQGRKQTRQGIKQRIQDINHLKKNKFSLVIFPQGTTSNGRGLLTFKNGAFENMPCITAFCLKYQCQNFQVGLDEIDQIHHFILMMSQLTRLTVKRLQFSPTLEQTSQQYEDRCRNKMAQTLNIPCTQGGYRDKVALQQMRDRKKQ